MDIDSNGDGVIDQVATDTTGNGVADMWLIDTNGDHVADQTAFDLSGDGVADMWQIDTDENGLVEATAADLDHNGLIDSLSIDANEDGVPNAWEYDTDGDGQYDETISEPTTPGVGPIGPADEFAMPALDRDLYLAEHPGTIVPETPTTLGGPFQSVVLDPHAPTSSPAPTTGLG
jgi:hypothetical protein